MKIDNASARAFSSDPGSLRSEKSLGEGSFAYVYDSIIPGLVLKEGHKGKVDKDMWLIWALYCIANEGMFPWMLKVEMIVIDEENDRFYALMEKLEPSSAGEIMGSAQSFVEGDRRECNFSDNDMMDELSLVIEELLEIVHEDTNNFYIDGHDANIMVRDNGEIVLTDILHKWGVNIRNTANKLIEKCGGRVIVTGEEE